MCGKKNRTEAQETSQRYALRTSLAWFQWLTGLADHVDAPIAWTVTRAVERYAEHVNYFRPPPARVIRKRR